MVNALTLLFIVFRVNTTEPDCAISIVNVKIIMNSNFYCE